MLVAATICIGRDQKPSAGMAFATKILRDPIGIADWLEFIREHTDKHEVSAVNSRLLRKPQRNYGVSGRTVRQRVGVLITHYSIAETLFSQETNRTLLGDGEISIGGIAARDTFFELWLGSSMPYGQKQEGELTVWLTNSDGISLARMAFSIGVDAEGRSTILIGGLQGLPAGVDKKVIVAATRTMSGLRPKDAVLVGVQAVAKALGIERILAVSSGTHVLATEWLLSDSVIHRDYDSFWKERGGVPEAGIGFALPQPDYIERARIAANPRLIDTHRATLTRKVLASLERTCIVHG